MVPQLWSILKGHVSFAGRGPTLFNQDDLGALRTQYGIDKLLPGLTVWTQINGRDELPIPIKDKPDEEYMNNQSFLFDVKIIFLTFFNTLCSFNIIFSAMLC